jgi:alpha-glucosidase
LRLTHLLAAALSLTLLPAVADTEKQQTLQSPNKQIEAQIGLDSTGRPTWSLSLASQPALAPSRLGLSLAGAAPLMEGFEIAGSRRASKDDAYTLPVGKTRQARDHYNELTLDLQEKAGAHRKLQLTFRAYDDGVAFRYSIPQQPGMEELQVTAENNEWHFADDSTCWAMHLKSFTTGYETEYEQTSTTQIAPGSFIALPFTAQKPNGVTVLVTEARLKDWAGMYLDSPTTGSATLISRLSPLTSQTQVCVKTKAPCASPWRVVLVADKPGKLIESTTILSLNDAPAFDTSWIKPGRTAWDWWSGPIAPGENFKPGTNNETIKHYIDFASEMGLEYMLIDEGWNANKNTRKKGQFDYDITKTVPVVDLPMLIDYAKQRNVGLFVWVHWIPMSRQMDVALPYYEKLGIKGIKVDFMERDDQEMVDFYHRLLGEAAKHHLLVDLHGAFKPVGLQRTYPNFVTQEGVMGAEYNKWSNRITPTYNLTLPYTRMVAGPLDYTPGGFNNVQPSQFEKRSTGPMVMATRAQELAKYVVYESEFQMLADYPGSYRGQAGVDFLKVVPANWEETRVLDGAIGQYIVMARRAGKKWFLGAMTNEQPRELTVKLDFLGGGARKATTYADGPNAAHDAKDITTGTTEVKSELKLKLAPSGGFAAVIE